MTCTNRCDVVATEYTVAAQIAGRDILFKTKGHDWTVCPDAELGDIILAACTLLDYEREAA